MGVLREDDFGDRYVVVRKLGEGGMGVVYEALDRERGARVALKTTRRLDAAALFRSKREFRALAGVSHRNLVTLYDLVTEQDRAFFTMELVEGESFSAYVRGADTFDDRGPLPKCRCDLEKLRGALRQLASGVAALHDGGKIHRDLKPSNVLVTGEGRVVVLDFGLAKELVDYDPGFGSAAIVGTAEYMSPEQALGDNLTEASDWYSVGVMLYEALAGRPPLTGTFLKLLEDKHRRDFPRPSELRSDVPTDLEALCIELLHHDPKKRPPEAKILRRLGVVVAGAPRLGLSTRQAPLVGREAHTERLNEAFAAVERGRTVMLLLHGASGMGKTELLTRFTAEHAARSRAVVLAGVCYEHESVSFKAFDGLVESLTQHLRSLPSAQAEALLPRDVAALVPVFPVLSRLEAVAALPRRALDVRNPHELRRRAFLAMRELIERLARRQPLVLWVDDAQWGDTDSAALFAELVRPPNPPPLLLLLSYRTDVIEPSPLLGALGDASVFDASAAEVTELHVGPLAQDDAKRLVELLLGDAPEAGAIAQESQGNPYFVDELVRHVEAGSPGGAPLGVDDALQRRMALLPADAKKLLDVAAIAGGPLAEEILIRAAELAPRMARKALQRLRVEHLLRSARGGAALYMFHDRVRETVLAALDPERARSLHERLALSLLAAGATSPDLLASHFGAAGDAAREAEFAIAAAEKAAHALAFDRAADLFARALGLGAPRERRASLLIALGESLANAGRGAEAATAFADAATVAPPGKAIELRRRGAEQLLLSGHFARGYEAINRSLRELGLAPARGPVLALLLAAFGLFLLFLRGLRFEERSAAQVDERTRVRLEALQAAVRGFLLTRTLTALELQLRFVRLALERGDGGHVALAFGAYAAVRGQTSMRAYRRALSLLADAQRLAATASPDVAAMVTGELATIEFAGGNPRRAHELALEAEETVVSRYAGMAWELTSMRSYRCWSLFYLGELRELERLASRNAADAQRRADLYAQMQFSLGLTHAAHLLRDDVPRAREVIDATIARWPAREFMLQHYYAFLAHAHTDLYAGDSARLWERLRGAKWPIARAFLEQFINVRTELNHLRACGALGMARDSATDPRARRRFLRAAKRAADALAREERPIATVLGALAYAGLATLEGSSERAQALYEAAAEEADACGMKLHGAAARLRAGELHGGDEGARVAEAARAMFVAEGATNPERFAAMLAPRLLRGG